MCQWWCFLGKGTKIYKYLKFDSIKRNNNGANKQPNHVKFQMHEIKPKHIPWPQGHHVKLRWCFWLEKMREFWNTTKKKKFIGQIYNGSVERWNFKQIESINSSWNYKWLSYFWPRPKNDSKYQKKFLRNFNKSAPLNIRRTSIQFRGSKRAINRVARKKYFNTQYLCLVGDIMRIPYQNVFRFLTRQRSHKLTGLKYQKWRPNPHKQIPFFEHVTNR